MRITEWLKILAAKDGSDLYLSTGAPPCAKFQGKLKPIVKERMMPGDIKAIAYEVMDEVQQAEFERELEMNLAISIAGVGRFRINIFVQRDEVSLVARNIVRNRVTLGRWIENNDFPPGFLIGPNSRAWPEDQVEAWLVARATETEEAS